MKAVVLHEYGGPSKLKYEDVPDPVAGPGEALVRVAAVSINPVDYKMRSGEAKERFPVEFPGILGRDFAGIVRELGPDVTTLQPGDKVMGLASATYAELVAVKAEICAKIPEGMEMITAASLPLVLLTGTQLIRLGTRTKAGETVLVTGAVGAVGRAAVWAAKKAGATVIAGVRKSQLEEAEHLGADKALALDDHTAMEGLGFLDAIADTVGGKTAETLLGKVKQGGVFASVVSPPVNAQMHPTVQVARIMATPDAAMLRELAEDVQAGHLKIPIDRVSPLGDAGEAQAAVEKGGIGKIVLTA